MNSKNVASNKKPMERQNSDKLSETLVTSVMKEWDSKSKLAPLSQANKQFNNNSNANSNNDTLGSSRNGTAKSGLLLKEIAHAILPGYHFKCRWDKMDKNCESNVFTRTKDVVRFNVPHNKINWSIPYPDYNPTNFTSDKIKLKDNANYKDPDLDDLQYKEITFNDIDKKFNVDRKSLHGPYPLIRFNKLIDTRVPQNPVGRTGIIGRGHLGRWGPNHAADPIVTQWKRDEKNEKVYDKETGKPILQFVSIQRRDTKEWAIPGGMRDPGEVVTKTLVREFCEEALSRDLKFDKANKVLASDNMEKEIKVFFQTGVKIYQGYVDDPRNTDNSWMETIAHNFHDETSNIVGKLCLKGGSDADSAKWTDLTSTLPLFASHSEFLHDVALLHNAHW